MTRAPFQILVLPYRHTAEDGIQYALFRRSDLEYWQGIAGGGEGDETPLEAARRESEEEAGISSTQQYITLDAISSIPVIHFAEHESWGDDVHVIPEYAFGVDATGVECAISDEHSELRWLPYQQAHDLLQWESNRTALWELHRRLQQGINKHTPVSDTDMSVLTHLDEEGNARMVDVSGKEITEREARAEAVVRLSPAAYEALKAGTLKKGDALNVARLAGIMAAKRTDELIPLCHTLPLSGVSVEFRMEDEAHSVHIISTARVTARTGVEMEAMTAASVAALTVYDMCKAIDKGIVIERIQLLEKRGGKSGDYRKVQ